MIKPLQTLDWKFHGVSKCHNCYESEHVQRILRKAYHSTILFASSRTTAIVAPDGRLIPMSAHIHNVPYLKASVTHTLNGGCSETTHLDRPLLSQDVNMSILLLLLNLIKD